MTKAGFGYDNSVSLQTDDVGNVGAAVFAHVAFVVGLQTNDVRCNRKGLKKLPKLHDDMFKDKKTLTSKVGTHLHGRTVNMLIIFNSKIRFPLAF